MTLVTVVVTIATRADLGSRLRVLYASAPGRAEMAQAGILTYLFTLAATGLVLWLGVSRAVKAGKRWARTVATGVFAVATLICGYNFTQPHPLPMSLAGMLPSLAGLAAVALLWTRGSAAHFTTAKAVV
ncbi:hypothetical protein [Streptomyces sp. MST-110588]|uniref:hypothetical protein n=1 Tax=Streptomyces sp. MST-110588 TaxID=2833628 RepID=UPI001F5D934B|nr:hypothetical protein [Streptomyces sp. MST-110588]UNO40805.1 hypothetical protein KGS77_15975 [Streptomyces sp. MST-110588]